MESHDYLFSGLNQRAVAGKGLRQERSLCHRVQLLATILYRSMMVPLFLGECSENSPFLLIYKEAKGKLPWANEWHQKILSSKVSSPYTQPANEETDKPQLTLQILMAISI